MYFAEREMRGMVEVRKWGSGAYSPYEWRPDVWVQGI
jgi:hypothetical protein